MSGSALIRTVNRNELLPYRREDRCVTKKATSSTTDDSDPPIGVTGVLGILLLVGGVVAALYAHQNMAEFQSTGGQIVRALSQQQQQGYQTLSIVRIGGVIAAVVGGVLAIADIS